MRQIINKMSIIVALAIGSLLGLVVFSDNASAYLVKDTPTVVNTFTFASGSSFTDTVTYYLSYNNNTYSFANPGQETWTRNAGAQLSLTAADFATAPNGLEFAYVTINGTQINTTTYVQPSSNLDIRVYFQPITYTIEYSYKSGVSNGNRVTISNGSLMESYTVLDYIKLPYGKTYEKLEEEESFDGYTYETEGYYNFTITYRRNGNHAYNFQYWTDNNNVQHTFESDWTIVMGEMKDDWGDPTGDYYVDDWTCPGNNGSSWCSAIAPTNGLTYADFINRQIGNLSLTATWQSAN